MCYNVIIITSVFAILNILLNVRNIKFYKERKLSMKDCCFTEVKVTDDDNDDEDDYDGGGNDYDGGGDDDDDISSLHSCQVKGLIKVWLKSS